MIYIASDHRGFELKQKIYQRLVDEGLYVSNLGNKFLDPNDDYTDFAQKVAQSIKDADKGILLCGSGVGMDIAANKFPGIRSALVSTTALAKQSREHEDVNVLSLPADILDEEIAWEIVKTFLNTPFSNEERHIRRLSKLSGLETKA